MYQQYDNYYQQPAVPTPKPRNGWLDKAQNALNMAGFLPGVGSIADGVNAAIYAARGDMGNAAFSAVAAIPGLGDAAGAMKMGKNMMGKAGRIAGRFM